VPKGCYEHKEQTTKVTIDEAYEQLKAAILMQAISDYWFSCKALHKPRQRRLRQTKEYLIYDCKKFFEDPPYDFGDVDTRRVKLMLDTAAREGFDLIITNKWRYEQ